MLTQKQNDAMIVVLAKISAILQREPFMLYNNVDHRLPDPVKKLRIVCPQNFDFFRYRRDFNFKEIIICRELHQIRISTFQET